MTVPNAVDLSTIIGRIVAALRQEQGASQATLAGRMTWDRSLLARIEAGVRARILAVPAFSAVEYVAFSDALSGAPVRALGLGPSRARAVACACSVARF
jgi:transcriptional regulator with XRE-family HTH domain